MSDDEETAVADIPLQANVGQVWRQFFTSWPNGIPRRGILVTCYHEQIPFDAFFLRDDILLLDRKTPDNLGARKVILPYAHVLAVKIVEPLRNEVVLASGFQGTPAAAGHK